MTSPLFYLFFFLLSYPFFAIANIHKTHNLLKQTNSSSYDLFTSRTLNETTPTVYFEVTKPIKIPNPRTRPCSHLVLSHSFASTYGKPPITANYTLPSHCPFKNFSKIVLEWKATCKGRQFDRIFGVWLEGVELLRSCTAEPRASGIKWRVKKDVTRYYSLLVKNEPQTLAVFIGNVIDKTYTGVYNVDIWFHFFPAEENPDRNLGNSVSAYSSYADLILPISRNLPLNDGLWLKISNSTDSASKEIRIARNVYRAVLEVYVSFHENDEFWYGNLPNDYVTANNLTAPGNGPFREVVVTLDGEIAGAVWPFAVVYTGGINPLLWRPITGIGSFDLPTYDIEITPFLGSLLDGKPHNLKFRVTNALNVWYIDANLHLWLDSKKTMTKGKVLRRGKAPLDFTSLSHFQGLNGKFQMKASRSIYSAGWVESSHGKITTTTTQKFSYGNKMRLGKDGNLQLVDQLIRCNDRVYAKKASLLIHSTKSSKNFPFRLYSDYVDQGNGMSLTTAHIAMSFNEVKSGRAGSRFFQSNLKNKQEGTGTMVVKDNLVNSGLGSTKQVYKYDGRDHCYFRNISTSNYTILYDQIKTVCSKRLESGSGSGLS